MFDLAKLKKTEAAVRLLKDIEEVLYDREWYEKTDKAQPLYWMWRGLNQKDGLRYDILRFNEGSLGQELMKTVGHGHGKIQGQTISYPELYQTITGRVIYLLQKIADGQAKAVTAVECGPGDFCLIPPDFEHITINLEGEKTFMANWIALDNRSEYESIKEKKGAAYYGLSDSPIRWLKNENYDSTPELKIEPPTDLKALGIDIDINMLYNGEILEALNFLKDPADYPDLWKKL